jgi:hypothetical protein
MDRLVLEDFHYARDGVNPNLLKAGTRADILPEHAERFEAEGKIAGPKGEQRAPVAPAAVDPEAPVAPRATGKRRRAAK